MAVDPLSVSTRKARTGLLIFSAAGILVKTFNVSVTNVEMTGVDLDFPESLLSFTLISGAVYFTITFLISAVDDVINHVSTPYTKQIIEMWNTRREKTQEIYLKILKERFSSFYFHRTHSPYLFKEQAAEETEKLYDELTEIAKQVFAPVNYEIVRSQVDTVLRKYSRLFEMTPELILDSREDNRTNEILDELSREIWDIQDMGRQYEGKKNAIVLRYSAFKFFRLMVIELGAPILLALLCFGIWLQWISLTFLIA